MSKVTTVLWCRDIWFSELNPFRGGCLFGSEIECQSFALPFTFVFEFCFSANFRFVNCIFHMDPQKMKQWAVNVVLPTSQGKTTFVKDSKKVNWPILKKLMT